MSFIVTVTNYTPNWEYCGIEVHDTYETMEDVIEEFCEDYLNQPPVHRLQDDRYTLVDEDQFQHYHIAEITVSAAFCGPDDGIFPHIEYVPAKWDEELSTGCDI